MNNQALIRETLREINSYRLIPEGGLKTISGVVAAGTGWRTELAEIETTQGPMDVRYRRKVR